MRRIALLAVLLSPAGCAFQPQGDGSTGDDLDGGTGDATDARSPPHVDADDAPPPTWSSDMTGTSQSDFYPRHQPSASVELDIADAAADDGKVARLVFEGAPGLGTYDRVGPPYASELATVRDDFHFGTYRMRARLAACAPGEEVVNGLFTYRNDGEDHDADGIADNSEIDLEILCGTPDVLFMSVWTDYSVEEKRFRKWTRAIDFATGAVWESPAADEHGLELVGVDPALRRPGLLAPDHFVELGFEWRADRVRYFAVIDGAERTLAELADPARVPQQPAALIFNVWHPGEHWIGSGGPPDFPAHDATLLVDWARYWR